MTGSKSLGDTGFLQILGLFQVIMANPEPFRKGGTLSKQPVCTQQNPIFGPFGSPTAFKPPRSQSTVFVEDEYESQRSQRSHRIYVWYIYCVPTFYSNIYYKNQPHVGKYTIYIYHTWILWDWSKWQFFFC